VEERLIGEKAEGFLGESSGSELREAVRDSCVDNFLGVVFMEN